MIPGIIRMPPWSADSLGSLHMVWLNRQEIPISQSTTWLASIPGHSQILSRSCGENSVLQDKIWEWPGSGLGTRLPLTHCYGPFFLFITFILHSSSLTWLHGYTCFPWQRLYKLMNFFKTKFNPMWTARKGTCDRERKDWPRIHFTWSVNWDLRTEENKIAGKHVKRWTKSPLWSSWSGQAWAEVCQLTLLHSHRKIR